MFDKIKQYLRNRRDRIEANKRADEWAYREQQRLTEEFVSAPHDANRVKVYSVPISVIAAFGEVNNRGLAAKVEHTKE